MRLSSLQDAPDDPLSRGPGRVNNAEGVVTVRLLSGKEKGVDSSSLLRARQPGESGGIRELNVQPRMLKMLRDLQMYFSPQRLLCGFYLRINISQRINPSEQ